MGGTFDPIHHGHLVAAEETRCAFDLEQVVFVPAGRPWQKAGDEVSAAEERREMVEAATDGNPAFEVSRSEIDRGGPTYTIDTLRDFSGSDRELYFITGADAILQILTWREPEEAARLATFVAVSRPGYDLGRLSSLDERIRRRVETLEIPALAISSTDIRRRVAEDRPIRYLVPDAVERYIREHGLYR